MPKNDNSQTNPNPISQIFMNKANEQFSKIKKLNFSPTPSIDDIKKLKAMSEYAEKYFNLQNTLTLRIMIWGKNIP
ncbi:MAG TPA: hypothetical protein LFV90_05020 [Rickettsia endosymbiont of Columbicola hoogstraali]|nr:hypothetical protein [Rickettsia endosymbiont of Columbicola hoogstraali]